MKTPITIETLYKSFSFWAYIKFSKKSTLFENYETIYTLKSTLGSRLCLSFNIFMGIRGLIKIVRRLRIQNKSFNFKYA